MGSIARLAAGYSPSAGTTSSSGIPSLRVARVGSVGQAPRTTSMSSYRAPKLTVDTYNPPAFPERISLSMPYSTAALDYKSPVADPAKRELDLGNFVPYLMERPLVFATEGLAAIADGIIDLSVPKGQQEGLHAGVQGVKKVVQEAAVAPVRWGSAVAAAAINLPGDIIKNDLHQREADFARALSDPNMSLDQAVGVWRDHIGVGTFLGGPANQIANIARSTTVATLRGQGLSDESIRRILFDAVDLSDGVKTAVVKDPKADVAALTGQDPEGSRYTYVKGPLGEVANLTAEFGIIGLEIVLGGAALGALKGVAVGTRLAPAMGKAGQVAVTLRKAGGASIALGTAIYGGTKVAAAIAKEAGNQQAYDWLNTTFWTRPLSDDPNACLALVFAFTGLNALPYIAKVGIPLRNGVTIGLNATKGARIAAIPDLETFVVDRLARMFHDDIGKGRELVRRYFSDTVIDTPTGKATIGEIDTDIGIEQLLSVALDIAVSERSMVKRAIYVAIPDGINRTTVMLRENQDRVWQILLDEPEKLITYWRGPAYREHFGIAGVQWNPDAMGMITVAYRGIKDATYAQRQALDAVVGMVDQVPPGVIRDHRVWLRDRYASAEDVVSNDDVTYLLSNFSGYRDAMRDVATKDPRGIIAAQSWTRGDLDRAMDAAAGRYAFAHKKSLSATVAQSLPENAPNKLIAERLETDELTVWAIMGEGPLPEGSVESIRKYLELKNIKTFDQTTTMTADDLRALAQEDLRRRTGPLYEQGRAEVVAERGMNGLRDRLAREVGLGDEARAAETQAEMRAYEEMNAQLRDPTNVPFADAVTGAVREVDLTDTVKRMNDSVARSAEAIRSLRHIDELETEAAQLIPNGIRRGGETALQTAIRLVFNGRFIGTAPRWSEAVLAKMAKAIDRTAGFDNPIDAANWIRANWRYLDGKDKKRLRAAAGGWGRGTNEIDRILARGFDEPTEWAESAGRSGSDAMGWESRVVDVAERYEAALAGWGGVKTLQNVAAKAGKEPVVPHRVQVGFTESLERRMSGAGPDIRAELMAAKAAMIDPATDGWTKVALMTKYGFSTDRNAAAAVLGVEDAWGGTLTSEFLVYDHPINVNDLKRRVDTNDFTGEGLTAEEVEGIASSLRNDWDSDLRSSLFDTDPILGAIAAAELKAANKLSYVVDPRLGLIEWERIDLPMAKSILAKAEAGVAKPKAGKLDAAVLSDDVAAIDAAVRARPPRKTGEKAPRKGKASPQLRMDEVEVTLPIEASDDLARQLIMAPPQLPGSFTHAQRLIGVGGSLSMRVSEKVMAAPESQRGIKVLGVLLHGSSSMRPNTVEGVLVALRRIENGTARRMGIGEQLQAEAQRAAGRLVDAAVAEQKAAGFYEGVITKGLAPWMIADADLALMRELIGNGFTISDPAHGLQYGLKKRPQNRWEKGAATEAADDVSPELQAEFAATHPGKTLKAAGAPAIEFEAARSMAAESHVPGLVDELLSGKFEPFEERLTHDATRRAYNLVFGQQNRLRDPLVKSAYARDPIGYMFGKLSSQSITTFVHDDFVTRLARFGVTPEESEAVWRALGQTARESERMSEKNRPGGRKIYTPGVPGKEGVSVVRGGRPQYGTIFNIPNADINAIARKAVRELHEADVENKLGPKPTWAMDRALDGSAFMDFAMALRTSASPILRHIEDGLLTPKGVVRVPFGNVLKDQYQKATTNVIVKTLYFVFRFGMDIRFAAMEFVEPYALGAGRSMFLEARYTRKGLMDMNERALSQAGNEGVRIEQGFIGGGTRRQDVMYRVYEKERSVPLEKEFARMAEEDAARVARGEPSLLAEARKEALSSHAGARGIADIEDPVAWEKALRAVADADDDLAAAIRDFDNGDVGRWLDELDGYHNRVLLAADPVDGVAGEVADIIAKNPHLSEIATRVGEVNKSVWEDIRHMAYGNMNRSRAERILNHPLLFWPLSYQIRATVWLADILFRRFGGKTTNALGAYELDNIMAAHNKAMAEDPGYRKLLDDHKTVLFVASMLLPITPDQIGVSLSPIMRDLLFDRSKSVFNIGPVYTAMTLLPRAVGELWQNVSSLEAFRDSPFGEPVQRVGQAVSVYPLDWEDENWVRPEDVAYNP